MATYSIWFLTMGLVALLIGVACVRRFLWKYPAFYFYLGLFLTVELFRFYIYSTKPEDYLLVFWWTQFLIVCAGLCVVWEIFNQALALYPGVLRMARFLVSALFVAVLAQASAGVLSGQMASFVNSVVRVERNMLAFQGFLLGLLGTLIIYYAVPLGKNLTGLLYGYSFRTGVYIVVYTLRSYLGPASQSWLDPLRQSADLVAVLIWLGMLWHYEPMPKTETATQLQRDYMVLAQQTSHSIAKARVWLFRMLVP